MIPYGKQDITQDDVDAVVKVLTSDYLTQGPMVPKFEEAVARYCGAERGVAVNSATSALHIAVAALGLNEDDILWTTPNTFVASANCARYCGAAVDFVDIDPYTYNMSIDSLKVKLKAAERNKTLPKIIVPVHMGGLSTQAREIANLVRPYGIKIVEDASHAIGGRYMGSPVGSCKFSDITVFSFHPVKIITTAEGGMALTNNRALAEKMSRLRSHGITRDPNLMTHAPDGGWYYQQIDLGWNYRMTEIQAALGISQLERLDEYVIRRNTLADQYDELLSELPVEIPGRQHETLSAFHLYIIRLKNSSAERHRSVFSFLRENGIGVNLHYIPVHLQPYYRDLGFKEGAFPKSEQYYDSAISIPLYPNMSNDQQIEVVRQLSSALSAQRSF